ncbi:hypothetical protein [Cellulomonas sp. P24]|nr:hypothetical protein [Cellulomonas sp. P24]MCR6494526.1 hypothetical protein [Cellulomonas sp. P24]
MVVVRDLTGITLALAAYNPLVPPVLDHHDHLIAVLTIDDVPEAAVAPE